MNRRALHLPSKTLHRRDDLHRGRKPREHGLLIVVFELAPLGAHHLAHDGQRFAVLQEHAKHAHSTPRSISLSTTPMTTVRSTRRTSSRLSPSTRLPLPL